MFVFASCQNKTDGNIVGKWKCVYEKQVTPSGQSHVEKTNEIYDFHSDGTIDYYYPSQDIRSTLTYEKSNNQIIIHPKNKDIEYSGTIKKLTDKELSMDVVMRSASHNYTHTNIHWDFVRE